jgi:hypothetical protein
VAPSGPDWHAIIADLARHLAAASGLEHVERILSDVDRDLARLRPPPDFWTKLRNTYDGLPRRNSSDNHASVSALLARRGAD